MLPPLPPGGRLLALGCDVIEVSRVAGVRERQGARFLDRVFTPEEQAYCLGHRDPGPFLAARFAAKEAVSKCFGTGIGAELGWKSIAVAHGSRGEPVIRLDEKGAALLRLRGASGVLVSLSHTGTVAMAVAALVAAE
jgi:holo-[acyl-carrier protein] synthase